MRPAGVQVEAVDRRFSLAIWMAAFIGLVAAVVGAKVCLELGLGWKCPVIAIFGAPCPSCGSTRAFGALAGFDVIGALRFNPLVVLGVLGIPLLTFSRYLPLSWRRHGWSLFAAAVILNWIYLMFFLPR